MPDPAVPAGQRLARGAERATWVVTAVVLFAVGLRVVAVPPGDPTTPQRLMGLLTALAACAVAALTIRRAPSIAWIAAVSAAGLGAVEVVAFARAWQPVAGVGSWPWLVAIAEASLLVGGAVAVASLGRARTGVARRLSSAIRWSAVAALAGLLAMSAWAVASATVSNADTDLAPIRITARLGLGLIVLGLVVGAVQDFVGPFRRARSRSGAIGSARGRRATLPEFARLLGDEMVPGSRQRRQELVDAERARLAADLHALVLPDLRRAAAEAASTGAQGDLTANLQRAVEDVEQLMHGRQSIVLDEFGLVAALEWLAERMEARAPLRVELELEGADIDAPSAIPRDVARVAFRVALLSLENVVRHANATEATVWLRTTEDGFEMTVNDDGRGLVAGAPAAGGRGLVDMRTEADSVGAALHVSSDAGTQIRLSWRQGWATGNHRTNAGDTTDRSSARSR